MKNKFEISGTIGDASWEQMRDFLIIGLSECDSEQKFLKLITALTLSIGTPKDLAKLREKMGIHRFTENDLDRIDKWKEEKNERKKTSNNPEDSETGKA